MTYLPPVPPLHVVRFTLTWPEDPDDPTLLAQAVGESSYKRGRLWTESATFAPAEDKMKLAPADWVHHIALTALQDRPNTQERLVFGLTGGLGVQDPLF